jgi:hypothetical protein
MTAAAVAEKRRALFFFCGRDELKRYKRVNWDPSFGVMFKIYLEGSSGWGFEGSKKERTSREHLCLPFNFRWM